MYSNLPNLIIGFHGCDMTTYKNVLYKHERLLASHNSYDWLGNGIYFWENSLDRAEEWAVSYCNRYNKKHPAENQKEPAVIGAVIGKPLPVNKNPEGSRDLLLRELDCAVIERIHQYNRENNVRAYDSVRGVFIEGNPVYEDSGIMEKTHTQLCIINPNCIKGYFMPLAPDQDWNIV